MKIMLDTDVLMKVCAHGHPEAKEWFRQLLLAPSQPELLASVLAEYELRQALRRRDAQEALARFEEVTQALRLVPVSPEASRRAVMLRGVSDADAIIAAQALEEGATLVTSDRAFRSVPGLDVRDWSEIDPERLASDLIVSCLRRLERRPLRDQRPT